jgi:hypothetical protein
MSDDKDAIKEIRRFGYFIPQPNGTLDIYVGVHVASEEVLAELHEVVSVVFNLQPIMLAYEVVEKNYREILELIEIYRSRLEGSKPGLPADISITIEGMISFSQKVTNFLSSTSAFLAQAEMQLRRVHGDDSSQLFMWNEKRRSLHASSFSYRFLYELRNFAQHRSIPFSNLNIAGERPSEELSMIFKVGIQIFRDALLDDGYKWGKLLAEIRQQPQVFDFLPMASEFLDCLRRLCILAARYQEARLVDCARYFDVVCKTLNIPSGAVPVLFIGEHQKGTPPSRHEIIPMVQFKILVQKYGRLLKECEVTISGEGSGSRGN